MLALRGSALPKPRALPPLRAGAAATFSLPGLSTLRQTIDTPAALDLLGRHFQPSRFFSATAKAPGTPRACKMAGNREPAWRVLSGCTAISDPR
jgi:hypothetical protein